MTQASPRHARWMRAGVLCAALLVSFTASAQGNKDAATTPKTAAPAKATAKAAPKPQSDWERAGAFSKKRQFDQACPLFEKVARETPGNASLWLDLSQCESARGRKPEAIRAAQHAVSAGDRSQRFAAYQLLRTLGSTIELPENGCDWLDEIPGVCEDQLWSCEYNWSRSLDPLHRAAGKSHTFGVDSDELSELEDALNTKSALLERLAMEWKALAIERTDESVCSACHAQAIESTDGLVNARAAGCFHQRSGRAPPADICVRPSADCEVFSDCLDDAAELARKSEGAGRALWPEAADVIAAAHHLCDATCGQISQTRCEVLTADACRGLVGYSCVRTERGKRPRVIVGELDVNDDDGNWSEMLPQAPRPASRPPSPAPLPATTDASKRGANESAQRD